MLGSFFKQLLGREKGAKVTSPTAPATNWQDVALQLRQQARHREVVAICRAQLEIQPDDIDALNFLASALFAKGDAQNGVKCLRRIAEFAPHSVESHTNLATALVATGDAQGAIDNYRSALRLRPDFTDGWQRLATLLKALTRYDEAEASCRAGLKSDAGHAALHHTLASTLFEEGRVDEAIAEMRSALTLNPHNAIAHSELLRMLCYADGQDPCDVFREHRAWAAQHARPLENEAPPHDNTRDPWRRLRVGYVSPYLHRHAVTFFLESVIQHHDPKYVELFLYADVGQPDEYSERLRAYGAIWRHTAAMDDAELARQVREDCIDILIDLSGHTHQNRLLTFARRPAPVQVNWLGFPSTTGMHSMTYRITDAWCDPPGATEHLNSETLVRLPDIYMAWRPPENMPDVGPLPASSNHTITFGSFHSCFKISRTTAALWARILHQVPDSRMTLLAISSEAAQRHVRELFDHNGIPPERLNFQPRLAFDDYLAAFRNVDIALDTYPYHGATTTCFSLWMGLPVVVLAGATHASRADVSMLTNVGLPHLVATSGDDYVAIASRLAQDLGALAAMRANLRHLMMQSPVTDGKRCARNLEIALRDMWVAWCGNRR